MRAAGRPANALRTRAIDQHPLGPSNEIAEVNCPLANEPAHVILSERSESKDLRTFRQQYGQIGA